MRRTCDLGLVLAWFLQFTRIPSRKWSRKAVSAQNTSLIQEYSQAFTRLQAGKKELIKSGVDAVRLNRFIVDAADTSAEIDPEPILSSVDLERVSKEGDYDVRRTHCRTTLDALVALQKEVVVLQKSATEKGVSAGLLTIIGQAANQSPADNGASVLRQLSELVSDDEPESASVETNTAANESTAAPEANTSINDSGDEVPENLAAVQSSFLSAIAQHWQPILFDMLVCTVATCLAISLVN